ncbi:MAG: sodium:solute symporter family protein [Saprospiraceae bacterium]
MALATFIDLELNTALILMGVIAVGYTVIGGLKAVIYTDTVQWAILMGGLVFIGIPISYKYRWHGCHSLTVSPDFLSLQNLGWAQFVNWLITIVPIWLVGMTSTKGFMPAGMKTAKKAWMIAGLFEYPVMAFMGVLLGLFARVAAEQGMFEYAGYATASHMDAEMGLPVLLRTVLPTGLMGLMLSAYFSAIMSTADSCLMAASGNVVTDILGKSPKSPEHEKSMLKISQIATLAIGVLALLLATLMQNVLELMLLSYAFMVSGLFVPVLGALYWKKVTSKAAFWAMLLGGGTTTLMVFTKTHLPFGLDANLAGITVSACALIIFTLLQPEKIK